MSKAAFDRKIAALEAIRAEPDAKLACDLIGNALRDRNNYLVSKAAGLASGRGFSNLIPDLLSAFDHFLMDPVKSDPQCWAKNAIAKALKDLGHHDADVYLKGIIHVQLEPVWGGRADSAAALRGTCALALVECPLDALDILIHISDRLADTEKTVRLDAARAIAQLNSPTGVLPLRLKILLGDSDSEVTGQCFVSVLDLTTSHSVSFVGEFLKSRDEQVAIEAAAALGQARQAEAIDLLVQVWRERLPVAIRSAIVTSLGASPLAQAAEFLTSLVAGESEEIAASALEALAASRFRDAFRDRVGAVVADKDDLALRQIFAQKFG